MNNNGHNVSNNEMIMKCDGNESNMTMIWKATAMM